jgi:AmiR/NasT family two-component response regulator
MTSCLLIADRTPATPDLAADFEAAGIHVIGAVQRNMLVQEAVRLVPDLVIVHESSPDEALFDSVALLLATRPTPLLLFCSDPDAEKMARALRTGVSAYVVNGYAPARLRSLVHLAQARFAHDRELREALADVSHRFEERKLVDRAKGILMRARQVSEDEAFKVLRMASMHSNQRVGQVSQQVIAAAGIAESVNRAGQLRMLSQRVVKLYALRVADPQRAGHRELLAQSVQRVDANLAALAKSLSKPTYGDLLDAVLGPWTPLKAALAEPVDAARLGEVDDLAEQVLLHADRLVNNLEATGLATSLHVINVSGRQRMLSQRLAKQALLGVLAQGDTAKLALAQAQEAGGAFEEALAYLNSAPLSSREIRESLDAAGAAWGAMTKALTQVQTLAGQRAVGDASEALLALFEQLTERYERSMQMLMG